MKESAFVPDKLDIDWKIKRPVMCLTLIQFSFLKMVYLPVIKVENIHVFSALKFLNKS